MPAPVRVAITGAAGQIGYSLLFRVASGEMLGPNQPVILQLLEITPALDALRGVAMELEDCAFPLLEGVVQTDDANTAFGDANYALLVGSVPRKAGMERADLLTINGNIFTGQGKALSDSAANDIKILVVGNPANTNCLIAMNNAPKIDPTRFTAMTRLDHNRAVGQLAAKLAVPVTDVKKMTIWGNHSATQYPDLFHCEVGGQERCGARRRSGVARERLHPDRAEAGRGDHRSPRAVERGIGRERSDRPHAHMGDGHRGRRLGEHGDAVRRFLRRRRGPHLVVPDDVRRRQVVGRAGPRHRRASRGAASTRASPSSPRNVTP